MTLPLALLLGACGDSSSNTSDTVAPSDATATDTAPVDAADTAPNDAADLADAADAASGDCGDVACEGFSYCDGGTCVAYPACADEDACAAADAVCRQGFCVPGDVDIDGDGAVARDDCDETRVDVNPDADEVCDGVDNDCDGDTDGGDPTALCAASGTGDVCVDGACACEEGAFDVDPEALGCECLATPSLDQGLSCANPIDLGDYSDTGMSVVIAGTLLPAEHEVWYRFRGFDSPDDSCDNYHVRVVFVSDPDAAYEFTVCRGSCDGSCLDDRLIDYDYRTDFRATIAGILTGQCPCTAPGAPPQPDVSVCHDDTAEYFVRVKRRPDKPAMCSAYEIEISNGLYDTL